MSHSDLETAGRLLREHVAPPDTADARAAAALGWSARSSVPGAACGLGRPWPWQPPWRPCCSRSAGGGAPAMKRPSPSRWGATENRQGGAYVSPPANTAWALSFSEGSVVELAPLSRGRVTRTTTHGAEVLLETGRAKVDVLHRADSDWTILAGPYTVRVTGTSFDVSFEGGPRHWKSSCVRALCWWTAQALRVPWRSWGAAVRARAGAPEVVGRPALASAWRGPEHGPTTSRGERAGRASSAVGLAGSCRLGCRSAVATLPPVTWAALAGRGEYKAVLAQAEQLASSGL